MKRIKKTSILLAVVLSLALLLSACANGTSSSVPASSIESVSTEDSLQRVLDAGKITFIGSGGYPPFNYFDESGNVVGFDVDVGAEIARRLGVELDYITGDWDGLTEGLRNKRFDGILGSMAITDARLEIVNFTSPYYYSGAQLVVRADSGITDPSEMSGKSIGVVTGTNFVGDAEALGADVRLYQDDNATLMDLINGRIDGVITDRLVALGAIQDISGGENLVLAGNILRLEQMGIAINKDDDTLLTKLNEILADMFADGTMKSISEKWHNGADITVK
ncbi:MAG TPA: transporter substrate-binding domain-containing protein [Oscillospiraceae bacterium]|nr:transporter substrate-binding domain-containing protein [Oscillospiraceae bacterium]HPF55001.1 transporter substrate-binding domain-containing protein [Clostridiales bacterium]HPK35931.1 transporter substrate-binding domain-containing protein [Oscillospiraceae bacterium]HPR75625.1 transporter substrate-binding domain-containing protein [Oscillospiraceae bacterium]